MQTKDSIGRILKEDFFITIYLDVEARDLYEDFDIEVEKKQTL